MRSHSRKSQKGAMIFLVLCIVFWLPPSTFSQTTSSPTNLKQIVRKGKIIKTDRTVQRGRKLAIDSETVTFEEEKTKEKITLPLSEVERVVKVGNLAVIGAVGGGVLTLLTCLLAVVEVETDPNLVLKKNAGAIIAGFTVGGTLVGALIGSFITSETTVYNKGTAQARISLLPRFVKTPGQRPGIAFITVNVLF